MSDSSPSSSGKPARYKFNAAVFVLLLRDNKVLLILRSNTGWCDGNYDLPAGHIDGGEYATVAAAREAKEEIGVTFDPADAQFVHLAHFMGEQEYIDIAFAVEKWQGEPQNLEPHKHGEIRWFALDALPENMTPMARAVLTAHTTGKQYSEIVL